MDAQVEIVKRVENSLNALRRELEAIGIEVEVTMSIQISLKTGGMVTVSNEQSVIDETSRPIRKK